MQTIVLYLPNADILRLAVLFWLATIAIGLWKYIKNFL